MDLTAIAAAFANFERVVRSEPGLAQFVPAVSIVCAQAQQLAVGQRNLELAIGAPLTFEIPNRELAEKVIDAYSRIPGPTGKEDAALVRDLGRIHAGLHNAIYYAVWKWGVIPPMG